MNVNLRVLGVMIDTCTIYSCRAKGKRSDKKVNKEHSVEGLGKEHADVP